MKVVWENRGEENLMTQRVYSQSKTRVSCPYSSLMLRFTEDEFDSEQAITIGVDFKTKTLRLDGVNVKLAIWDTAGQERFRTLTPSYYRYVITTLEFHCVFTTIVHLHFDCRDAQGAILVYDVSKKSSFQKLKSWLDELEIYGTHLNLIKMVVGNKIDQATREVSREEGLRFAKKHRTLFLETSAKTNEGVQNAFEELVRKILDTDELWERKLYGGTVDLDSTDENNRSYCNGLCSLT